MITEEIARNLASNAGFSIPNKVVGIPIIDRINSSDDIVLKNYGSSVFVGIAKGFAKDPVRIELLKGSQVTDIILSPPSYFEFDFVATGVNVSGGTFMSLTGWLFKASVKDVML